MLSTRVIPCLDVHNGRTVKGINFINLKDAGDPVEQAKKYSSLGADEICFLDISATNENLPWPERVSNGTGSPLFHNMRWLRFTQNSEMPVLHSTLKTVITVGAIIRVVPILILFRNVFS